MPQDLKWVAHKYEIRGGRKVYEGNRTEQQPTSATCSPRDTRRESAKATNDECLRKQKQIVH